MSIVQFRFACPVVLFTVEQRTQTGLEPLNEGLFITHYFPVPAGPGQRFPQEGDLVRLLAIFQCPDVLPLVLVAEHQHVGLPAVPVRRHRRKDFKKVIYPAGS